MIKNIIHKQKPLVSILVITFNSSKFVLETLESVRLQTYHNIELIVSDDCSVDGTVEIINDWITNSSNRFVSVKVITSIENKGITSNVNRALMSANGEWVKFIAGDDILDIRCIEKFVEATQDDIRQSGFIFCNKVMFTLNTASYELVPIRKILSVDPNKQLIKYACERPNIAPFGFYKKKNLEMLGGFDESYKFLEDAPLFFKALCNGYNFLLIDEKLVYYRISASSISNSTLHSSSNVLNYELRKFVIQSIIPFLINKKYFFNVIKLKIEYEKKSDFFLKTKLLWVLNKFAKVERYFLCN